MSERSHRQLSALLFVILIAFLLLEGLGRCMSPPTYSEYGEAPDYRD